MDITLLDVIRGKATMDQLKPGASVCHEMDLLTPKEVAALRSCSVKTVYDKLKQKRGGEPLLSGPPGEPKRAFGWSVLRLMGQMNPPQVTEAVPEKKSVAPRRPPSKPSASPLMGYRFLRVEQGDVK
jgi:hypothetical protein